MLHIIYSRYTKLIPHLFSIKTLKYIILIRFPEIRAQSPNLKMKFSWTSKKINENMNVMILDVGEYTHMYV